MNIKSFAAGVLIGAATVLSVSALAEYIVNPNAFEVRINGEKADIEGYNINDSTYFKLRDIGDKVGFCVDFNDGVIEIADSKSIFEGKKWIAYGDSITDIDFLGTTKYPELLGEYYGFESVVNYGVAGSCIAHTDGEQVICGAEIYNAHSSETADVFTVFYGTNDWFFNVPIGEQTDTEPDTLWGGFNTLIGSIKSTNPNSKIIIITPMWRAYASETAGGVLPYSTNGNGDTFEKYVYTIEEIARFHNAECLNLYEAMGVRQYDPADRSVHKYTLDNLHPDQPGQYRIANLLMMLLEGRGELSENPLEKMK